MLIIYLIIFAVHTRVGAWRTLRYMNENTWERSPLLLGLQAQSETALFCEDLTGKRDSELGALSLREKREEWQLLRDNFGYRYSLSPLSLLSHEREWSGGHVACDVVWPRNGSTFRARSNAELHDIHLRCDGPKGVVCHSEVYTNSVPVTLSISCSSDLVDGASVHTDHLEMNSMLHEVDVEVKCYDSKRFGLVGSFPLRKCTSWNLERKAIQRFDMSVQLTIGRKHVLSSTTTSLLVVNELLQASLRPQCIQIYVLVCMCLYLLTICL